MVRSHLVAGAVVIASALSVADCVPESDDTGEAVCSALPPRPDCAQCAQDRCDGVLAACLGGGWRTGKFSGPCAERESCWCECAADDVACRDACDSATSSDCADCRVDVDACLVTECGAQCYSIVDIDAGSGGTAAGGSGGEPSGGSGGVSGGGSGGLAASGGLGGNFGGMAGTGGCLGTGAPCGGDAECCSFVCNVGFCS